MGQEKANRILTSLLRPLEKKASIWLAERQPQWVTSDMLTAVGVIGGVICALGFILASVNVQYLWLSSLGLAINWYGDSTDGWVARVRHTQRPKYGFFIDHSTDGITQCFMCIGAGLGPMFRLDIALLVLSAYLLISTYTYITTIVNDEMRLTYGCFGPTELRVIIIIINTIYMYTPLKDVQFTIGNQTLGAFDVAGLLIAAAIFAAWLSQFLKDRKVLSKKDPLRVHDENANIELMD